MECDSSSGQTKFSFIQKDSFFYLCLFLLILCASSFFLGLKEFVQPDHGLLYGPLSHIHNFQEYWNEFYTGRIFDVQPLRDLFIFIDVWFFKKLAWDIRIYQNIFFWFLANVFVFKIVRLYFRPSLLLKALVLLFSVYPLFVEALVWISARKHLLSFSFILLATYLFLFFVKKTGQKKLLFFSAFAYLCSCLSQPINVLWPFCIFLFCLVEERGLLRRLRLYWVSLFFIMTLILFLNERYYSLYYAHSAGASKLMAQVSGADSRLLSLGRSFWQILFPYIHAYDYNPESYANLAGLLLLPIFFYFFWKKLSKKILPWGALFFAPLLVVFLRETPIFFLDIYVLTSAFAFFFLSLLCFYKEAHPRYLGLFLIPAVLFSAYYLREQTKYWENDFSVVKHSFESYPNCRQAAPYAYFLWERGQKEQALRISDYVIRNHCVFSGSDIAVALRDIFILNAYYGNFPIQDKIMLIKKMPPSSLAVLAPLALLSYDEGDKKTFFEIQKQMMAVPHEKLGAPYQEIAKRYKEICQKESTCSLLEL